MEKSYYSGPNHKIGYQTTVDIARGQRFNTTATSGVKRSHAQFTGPDVAEYGSILADRTNICLGNGFRRPTIGPSQKPSLQASEIRPVILAASQQRTVSEYSQRKFLAATPGPADDPLLLLSHPRYGLPDYLVQNFSSLGINSMYPWQSACLAGRNILSGSKNLVYTAPTGGGKSLVADLLMLKKVIENPKKKAILVLPYIALVQEKLTWLRTIVEGVKKNLDPDVEQIEPASKWKKLGEHSDIRVAAFFGGSKARATWSDVDIAVCTIEKVNLCLLNSCQTTICSNPWQANTLVNVAIQESRIDQLGIVVMDELHMLDDDHRGYLLELMATKLLSLQQEIQIVGLSATLSVCRSTQPLSCSKGSS